jgi:hypothetical protein
MSVEFKDMQENVPYRWAGNSYWTQQEAFELTDRHFVKIGEKLIDQLTKKDISNPASIWKDVFIRVTEL